MEKEATQSFGGSQIDWGLSQTGDQNSFVAFRGWGAEPGEQIQRGLRHCKRMQKMEGERGEGESWIFDGMMEWNREDWE